MKTIEKLYTIYKEYCSGNVTTDTRKIAGGELFFALKGENFDGDQFVARALELGASYAVASTALELDDPRIIKVESTLETLWELAAYHREHVKIPTVGENGVLTGGDRVTVIGLTGTNGKTTTKELIRAVLSVKYNVAATEGNLNNNIGVPLTILKMRGTDMASETSHDIALVEMGASHPGDINELVAVSHPDIGLITNVGRAHLLGFGSFEGVKATKGELYDYILNNSRPSLRDLSARTTGRIFLNVDNPDLVGMAESRDGLETVPYGVKHCGAEILPADNDHPFLRIRLNGRTIETKLVGAYNADNVLAAITVGDYFGVGFEEAAGAIEGYVPANNRSMMQKTDSNTLIVDAYNANPSSMAVALDNFASVVAETKIACLGDMRELGEESVALHAEVVSKLLKMRSEGCLAKAYLVGEEFRKALVGSAEEGIEWFETSEALAAYLTANKPIAATVLVKGSRGIRMETVIPCL